MARMSKVLCPRHGQPSQSLYHERTLPENSGKDTVPERQRLQRRRDLDLRY